VISLANYGRFIMLRRGSHGSSLRVMIDGPKSRNRFAPQAAFDSWFCPTASMFRRDETPSAE